MIIEQEEVLKNVKVKINGKIKYLDLVVLTRSGPTLIGRLWLKAFDMWPIELSASRNTVSNIGKANNDELSRKLAMRYPQLFGPGAGEYNKGTLKLIFKDNAQPIALKPRKLPFALMTKVENELDRLLKLGHLERVNVCD